MQTKDREGTFINGKKGHALMNSKRVDGITVDTESIVQFISLLEKKEWSEKDLDTFVSTEGVQYIIQQEKDSGPNVDEDTVKTFLKKVNRKLPGELEECGGWATAYKEKTRIQKRLEYIFSRWNYLVERPLSVATDYIPRKAKGTFYFVPGGARESYSDGSGFAINLGCGARKNTQWMFLIALEGYRYFLIRAMGEKPYINRCRTPTEFVEAFLNLTHREGMALFVGLKAAGTEKQFYQEYMRDGEKIKDTYGKAFQLALEGKAPQDADRIQKEVFSGYTSPAALLGSQMAKTLDESDKRVGHTMGKDMLLGSIGEMGFIPFFEVCRPHEIGLSLFPDVVWEAFEKVKKERGVESVGEVHYFP